jgi:hypothetical protein
MNRHLQQYSALPTDALGPPMRAEPEKPADGPWKHLRPGYGVEGYLAKYYVPLEPQA